MGLFTQTLLPRLTMRSSQRSGKQSPRDDHAPTVVHYPPRGVLAILIVSNNTKPNNSMISLDPFPSSSKPHQHGSDITPAAHERPASVDSQSERFADSTFVGSSQKSDEFPPFSTLKKFSKWDWSCNWGTCVGVIKVRGSLAVHASPDFAAMTVGLSSPTKEGQAYQSRALSKLCVAVDPLPSPTVFFSPRARAKKQHDPHLGKKRWGLVPGLAAIGFDKLKEVWKKKRFAEAFSPRISCFNVSSYKTKKQKSRTSDIAVACSVIVRFAGEEVHSSSCFSASFGSTGRQSGTLEVCGRRLIPKFGGGQFFSSP